ncbi:hypothetical protein ANN_16075 [Periplaneta americana]|uniref:Vacuolar protein 14 C-terminal Fig4-binding domain-containing protein n=1 Tax=Periplaneta americana TaxID=6978 RepID=A0ABQ8SIE6_PERAM|nr:hypothetical protein ANN_16075 [Periplaneta americana]
MATIILYEKIMFCKIPANIKTSFKFFSDFPVPVPVKQLLEGNGSGNSQSMNPYFSKFIVSLLRSFSTDRHHLLEDRGAFIIRQLCVLLNSEDIYRTLSEILLHEEDLKFASNMVETLNTILLTSSELFELRTKLKDLNTEVSCSRDTCNCRLQPIDYSLRANFSILQHDEDFLDLVIFSDESTFHLNGCVNTHNVRIWGSANPHEMVQLQQDSPKLNSFCAISRRKIYGPFFFGEATVTGASYLDALQQWLFPQLEEGEPENFIWQQDDTLPHWHMEILLVSQVKNLRWRESCLLFCCLYKSWAHNPVATVALCLLTQNYSHVCDLIRIFANLEVTVDFLTEIDKLVQLLESPIFTYLRLELLEVPHNQHLVQALYGLLMLLPQTEAFNTLRQRLDCIPSLHLHCCSDRYYFFYGKKSERSAVENWWIICFRNVKIEQDYKVNNKHINFTELLQHFVRVQDRHRQHKQSSRTIALLEKGVKSLNT